MYGRGSDVNEERKKDIAHKFIQRIRQIHQAVDAGASSSKRTWRTTQCPNTHFEVNFEF
jgi:hypothetical protein